MERILLVEDDREIRDSLTKYLRSEGFECLTADGRASAEKCLSEESVDLALLDVSLSDGNGFSLCAFIRQQFPRLPVIFVTASDDEYSVVAGLDMGADDYITKPFRPRELLSRVRASLRRAGRREELRLGGLTAYPDKGIVCRDGKELPLSALEYKLLMIFMANRGAVLTRAKLLDELWDAGGDFVTDNTLTVYIKRLREKIEDDPQNPALILTVRGVGYRTGE